MTKVLFICRGNTCRSPMARALAQKLGGGLVSATAAGLTPGLRETSPEAIKVLEEIKVPLPSRPARTAIPEQVAEADLVIALGVELPPSLNAAATGKILSWDIPDPLGGGLAAYRKTRDLLRGCIADLLIDLSDLPAERRDDAGEASGATRI